ncbi:MAG: hypothetical protein ABEJ31_04245 [Haloarculaceae archaeon]
MSDDAARPTADDVGEPIVSESEGIQLGTIAGVEDDQVLVDADPNVADDVRGSLAWGDLDQTHPLPLDAVVAADDGTFRVRVPIVDEDARLEEGGAAAESDEPAVPGGSGKPDES